VSAVAASGNATKAASASGPTMRTSFFFMCNPYFLPLFSMWLS
jgi:hypothetical protein